MNQLGYDLRNYNRDAAEQECYKALEKANLIGYTKGIGESFKNLGIIHKIKAAYVEAYNMYLNSLEKFEAINDTINISHVKNNLGNLLIDLENFDDALVYYVEANDLLAKYLETQRDSSSLNEASILSGKIKLNIGTIRKEHNELTAAKNLFHEALDISSSKKDTISMMASLINLGESFKEENPDSTKFYYWNCMELAKIKKDPMYLMHSYYYVGKLHYDNNLIENALEYLLIADEIANTLDSPKENAEISGFLDKIYYQQENFEKAYYFLKKKEENEEKNEKDLANKYLLKTELIKAQQEMILAKQKMTLNYITIKNKNRLFYSALACLAISILFVFTVYRNYRIKRKANRLLTEMDELKSRLFSNITHEFRTPLTLIIGPLEEMLAAGEKKTPKRKEIKMMRRNANRLLTLVNQMLDLAKLDARSLKLELSEGDFIKFAKIRMLAFSSLAGQKKIRYTPSVPEEKLITLFDSDKLEKIINNLLSNAFKFTEPGGEVNSGVQIINQKKETVEFFVSDTGGGIPEDQLNRIFDRFHQVEGSAGNNSFGTGIGLSLTKELVTLMHGEISVESELGKGTKFTVKFPLGRNHLNEDEYILVKSELSDLNGIPPEILPAEEEIEAEDECLKISGADSDGKRSLPIVITVEDQKEIRSYIREYLQDCFRVMEASNGKQGLELAIEKIPDLVITDLMMPEMDGIQLCKKLKTDERTSHIPVVMLTAKADTADRLKGIETGADAYLTKPFNMQELKLVAGKLIEQRKKLRERFSRDVKLEPKDIAITSADEKFLNRALAVIETHMGDSEFEVNDFQDIMAMSRMQLFRKIKALTDQTPSEFIRTIRLKRAAKLIEQGFGNIAEVTFEVGFNNPSHFAKCFKELYGSLPSDYAKDLRKN